MKESDLNHLEISNGSYNKQLEALLKRLDFRLYKVWLLFSILPFIVVFCYLPFSYIYFGLQFVWFDLIFFLFWGISNALSMLIMKNLSYHLTTDLENPKNLIQFLQLGRYDWVTRNRKWILIGVSVYLISTIYLPFVVQPQVISDSSQAIFTFPDIPLILYSVGAVFFFLFGLIFVTSFYFFVKTSQRFRFEPKKGVEYCLKGLSNILSDSLNHKSDGSFILNNDYPSVYKMLLEECYIYLEEYLSKSDQVITGIKELPLYFTNIYLLIKYGTKNELNNLIRNVDSVILFLTNDDVVKIVSSLEEMKNISPEIGKTSRFFETHFQKLTPLPTSKYQIETIVFLISFIIGAVELIRIVFQFFF